MGMYGAFVILHGFATNKNYQEPMVTILRRNLNVIC